MDNPISAPQNRNAGNPNPNPIAANQIHTPPDAADDHDRKLHHLFSAAQNLAASRDSSTGVQHSPVCVHPLTSSNSERRPVQTDFFREVSLFNAHFGSEPERSRWAQFLPEYLRPGNLENHHKQTKKPQLFDNNFWWASQESTGQDCNNRLATVHQRKMPLLPDGRRDLQSSKPCSRRSDHILYSRDRLLQLREVKTVSEAIMKIKQGIEVDFLGVNQKIKHGTTIVDNSGTQRASGLTSKEMKEEKKVANITVNANQEFKTREKAEQEGVSKNKKRGMSDERKAKRKMKERKKRAEKDRKLGVKRLRIQPILKAKPVSHCRHYIVGRCYEGETCKFSHDVVPLTKAKPCCHFARQACMKGDDCPFDHQLSKYPCNNYASNGYCNRGESCSFSHEITQKQDSESAIGIIKPETKSLNPSPFTSESTPTPETWNKPAQERKGLNFPLGASANHKQANLSQKSHFSFQAGAPTSGGTLKGTPASMAKSSAQPYTVENLKGNISPSKVNQPVKTPKGLTFLNAGNLQRDEQTSQKTSNGVEAGVMSNQGMINIKDNSSPSKVNQPVKTPKGFTFLNTGNLQRKDSARDEQTFQKTSNGVEAGVVSNQGVINIKDNISPSKVNQPVKTPKGFTFLNTGNLQGKDSARDEQTSQKTSNGVEAGVSSNQGMINSISNHGEKKQFSFPTFGNRNLVASAGDQKDSSDTNQKSNVVPFKFPASTSSSSPFLTRLDNAQVKNASSSGHRSFLSTLAFASKYDSGATRDSSIDTPAFGTEVNMSRTQLTESPANVSPSIGTTIASGVDGNKNAGSSSSSSPFLTRLENAQVNNASSSGQRPLLSPLGFASKYDYGATRNSSIDTPAFGTEVSKSGGFDHCSRTQLTESPINVNPSVGTTGASADANKNAGASSTSETGHKKPANPLEMWEMLYGGGS